MDTTLTLAPEQPGEAPMKQLAPFDDFRSKLEELKTTAETLAVTDSSQTAQMKIARATRLSFRDIRVAIEHRREELVSDQKRQLAKIDRDAKAMKDFCAAQEERLLEMEEFALREAIRIEDEKRNSRTAELTPFLVGPIAVDLGKLSDSDWTQMLASFREAHEARALATAKAEAERVAREKAEAEERERIRLENERLKKEAEEREAAALKEREEAAARLKAEQEKAQREREAARAKADAEAKKLREEAAERERIAKEKAEAEAEKARKEREAIEARAKAEREAAEANAREERVARDKAEAELRARLLAEERAALERKKAEAKAAAAPDREKLLALARTFRELHVPILKTENGIAATVEISAKIEDFAAWITKKADGL